VLTVTRMTQKLCNFQALSQVAKENTRAHARILWEVVTPKCIVTFIIGSVQLKTRWITRCQFNFSIKDKKLVSEFIVRSTIEKRYEYSTLFTQLWSHSGGSTCSISGGKRTKRVNARVLFLVRTSICIVIFCDFPI